MLTVPLRFLFCLLCADEILEEHRRKSLKRGVAMHRTSVRAEKEVRVIAKATLLKCRTQAAQVIPELLSK